MESRKVMMNIYIRLFLLKRENQPFRLLYGYGLPDEVNEVRGWKKRELGKRLGIYEATCVMSEEKCTEWKEELKNEEICLKEEMILEGNLTERPQTIFYPKNEAQDRQESLIKSLATVEEYWNLNKAALFEDLETKYKNAEARTCREKIHKVLSLISAETSLDFLGGAAERLGNIEFYHPIPQSGQFEWEMEKIEDEETFEQEARKVVLSKKVKQPKKLIVNCVLENAGRCILNQTAEWGTEEDTLAFEAAEAVSAVQISIWGQAGDLIYYKKTTLMRCIQISGNIISNIHYLLNDSWTKHLRKTFGGYKEKLETVEKIQKKTEPIVSKIGGFSKDPWHTAGEDAGLLVDKYAYQKGKGAFCKKVAEGECEIDSFCKIADYLNDDSVAEAIIVDPYFSVYAMEKVLSRITNTGLKLKIVTSLSVTNPDEEGAAAKQPDYLAKVKRFLSRNYQMLHSKVQILNVTHENNTAIHDRYLLQLKKDGTMEGYLLSNSINSAGKNYSFVIASMDKEVTYEVLEYVQEITDEEYQKKQSKQKRLNIETLWDTLEHKFEPEEEKVQEKPWETEMKAVYQQESLLDLEYFFKEGWQETEEEAETNLLRLCWYMYYTEKIKPKDCLQWLRQRGTDLQKLLETGMRAAAKLEQEEALWEERKKRHSEAYQYRTALDVGKQEQIKINEAYIFRCFPHIFYERNGYLSKLYRLLFMINPERMISFMEEIHAPLLFEILINEMTGNEYRIDIYRSLQKSNLRWLSNFSYYYFWEVFRRRLRRGEELLEKGVEQELEKTPLEAVFQYACWLENLTFLSEQQKGQKRRSPEQEKIMEESICHGFEKLRENMEKAECAEESRENFFRLFVGADQKVNSNNVVRLWQALENEDWKRRLEEWGVEQLRNKWKGKDIFYSHTDYDMTNCAAYMALQYWGEDIGKMCAELVLDERALQDAVCPGKYDINYEVWKGSVQKVLHQLLFLKYYCRYWKQVKSVEQEAYLELLKLRKNLGKVKSQCEKWYDNGGLISAVFDEPEDFAETL